MRIPVSITLVGLAVVFCSTAFAEVRYNGAGLRDPFSDPFASAPKSVPEFNPENLFASARLEGVLYGTDKPRAIINGKIYSLGDNYNSWKVERIEDGSVTFSSNGNEYQLKQNLRKTTR